jgi:hypothetical protein
MKRGFPASEKRFAQEATESRTKIIVVNRLGQNNFTSAPVQVPDYNATVYIVSNIPACPVQQRK